MIGGLQKKNVVRSVNKLPWLGDLPLIGWAVSSESEVHKTSELVAVIECAQLAPDSALPENTANEIKKLSDKVNKYGIKAGPIDQNDYGFDQYLFDCEKKGIDSPPYSH